MTICNIYRMAGFFILFFPLAINAMESDGEGIPDDGSAIKLKTNSYNFMPKKTDFDIVLKYVQQNPPKAKNINILSKFAKLYLKELHKNKEFQVKSHGELMAWLYSKIPSGLKYYKGNFKQKDLTQAEHIKVFVEEYLYCLCDKHLSYKDLSVFSKK